MAYHNLCKKEKPPPALGNLLGLGLKFCIQDKKPSEESLQIGIKRFKRDIRLKHSFAGQLPDSEGYNPKIYIKSKYNPKPTYLQPPLKTNSLKNVQELDATATTEQTLQNNNRT